MKYSSDRACPCHAQATKSGLTDGQATEITDAQSDVSSQVHPHMLGVAGIILAGGRSSRMGSDKALLPLSHKHDVTFVEHQASLLLTQCSEVLLVVRDAEQASLYQDSRIVVLTDETANSGPLMGLYSGLRAIHSTHALVIAVDMPSVLPEMITFLLSQPLDEQLVVPIVYDVPQVLFAMYPRSIVPLIGERLQAGRRDPRSLLDIAPVRYLDEQQLRVVDPELRSFANLNTPEDYHTFLHG